MRIVMAFLVLAASGPAVAQQPATTDSAQQPRERVICRRITQTTSRMGARRICRTEAEWRAARGGRSEEEVVADNADTLAMQGREATTGDLGGMTGGGPR